MSAERVKKRLLIISDTVIVSTGYSTVAKNIIQRLVANDNYEIAQLGLSDRPGVIKYPIHYYSTIKDHTKCCRKGKVIEYREKGNPEFKYLDVDVFPSLNKNQNPCIKGSLDTGDIYGYDSVPIVINHFKPDIIIPINDIWGLFNISFLKNRDKFILLPYLAIDSDCLFPILDPPQERQHFPKVDTIKTLTSTDYTIVFTDWARDVINKTARIIMGKNITNIKVIPHGVDNTVWKPLINRSELREKYFGIKPNDKVFLTGCFLKDTPVLMSDLTYKPIQDIIEGDQIINHLGEEDIVVKPDPKEYEGDTYALKVTGIIDTITATQEHPFYSVKNKEKYKTEIINDIKFNRKATVKEKVIAAKKEWIAIKDLEVKDYVLEPINSRIVDISYIDTTEFNIKDGYQRNKIPDKIKIDNDFMRFLGLFVAEGSFQFQYDINNKKQHYSGLNISLNSKEQDLIDFIVEYAKKTFNIEKINIRRIDRNGTGIEHITIELNGMIIANFIKSLLKGDKCQTKHLDDRFMLLPIEKQKSFLQGWTEGDGCETKDGRNIRVTTCKNMAIQAGIMFSRLGIPYSINKDEYEKKLNKNHSVRYRITTWNNPKKQGNMFYNNGYIFRRITKISKNQYKGIVYNFEVKKANSYVVMQLAVHNSIHRNQPRKGLDIVMQTIKYFKEHYEKDRKLLCYFHCCLGDKLGWNLTWLAKWYGIEDRCIFDKNMIPGGGPPVEILNEIANCFDVHLTLSNSEGWALSILETMASGVPNIMSDYSAHADWAKGVALPVKIAAFTHESRTGFIKATANIESAARNIKILSESPKLYKEVSDKGLKLAQKLDWNNVCKLWIELLDSIDISKLKPDRYNLLKLNHAELINKNIPEDPTIEPFNLLEL